MFKKKKGIFITIEGTDGAGKTTCLSKVYDFLKQKNIQVEQTREPGGTKFAEGVRDLLLNEEIDAVTEALAFAAARRDHIKKFIEPNLKANKIVLCDRFVDSSFIYQTFSKKLKINDVITINRFAIEKLFPDLTIILLVEPKIALQRNADDFNKELNRLDKRDESFYQAINNSFKQLGKVFKKRIVYIDADNLTIKEITNQILEKINQRFKLW